MASAVFVTLFVTFDGRFCATIRVSALGQRVWLDRGSLSLNYFGNEARRRTIENVFGGGRKGMQPYASLEGFLACLGAVRACRWVEHTRAGTHTRQPECSTSRARAHSNDARIGHSGCLRRRRRADHCASAAQHDRLAADADRL